MRGTPLSIRAPTVEPYLMFTYLFYSRDNDGRNHPSTSSTAGSFKTSTIAKSRPTEYRTDSKHSVSSNHDAEETVGRQVSLLS